MIERHPPKKLESLLQDELELPEDGVGKDGLMRTVREVLRYSVNTWDQGFMDKLYASTNAVSYDPTHSNPSHILYRFMRTEN